MTKKQRLKSAQWLVQNVPMYEIAEIHAEDIDVRGIQKANGEVLESALSAISQKFHNSGTGKNVRIYIDHFPLTKVHNYRVSPLTKGEQQSIAIAAASIIAKVHRDLLMEEYAQKHPEYGWESNVGYGSAQHRGAILKHGPSPFHRKTFLTKILGSAL